LLFPEQSIREIVDVYPRVGVTIPPGHAPNHPCRVKAVVRTESGQRIDAQRADRRHERGERSDDYRQRLKEERHERCGFTGGSRQES